MKEKRKRCSIKPFRTRIYMSSAMFYRNICLFFVILDISTCSFAHFKGSQVPGSFTFEPHRKQRQSSKELIKYALTSPQRYENFNRIKRSIVLIDEDLDIPADPSIRHGWGGNFQAVSGTEENNLDLEDRTYSTVETTEASAFQWEKQEGLETVPTKADTTKHPQNLNTLEKLRMNTQETEAETEFTKANLFMQTPEKFQLTTMTENEGTEEGSGDTVFSVSYSVVTTTTQEVYQEDYSNYHSACLNKTCSSQDEASHKMNHVEEHSNVTLLCEGNINGTNHKPIVWYKVNGTTHTLLQSSKFANFSIAHAMSDQSGTYMCTWAAEEFCCHNVLHVNVYKKPNYNFHLMIIGVVAASAFLVCVMLVVSQKIRLKKQEKQMKKYMDNTEASFNLKVF